MQLHLPDDMDDDAGVLVHGQYVLVETKRDAARMLWAHLLDKPNTEGVCISFEDESGELRTLCMDTAAALLGLNMFMRERVRNAH